MKLITKCLTASVIVATCCSLPQLALANSNLVDNSAHFGQTGWEFSIGAGVFSASDNTSFYKRDNDDLEKGFFIPLEASYIGDSFYFKANNIEGLLLGYTISENDNWALDAVLSPRLSGFNDNDLLDDAGINERDPDLHGGIRYSTYLKDSRIRVELSKDIANTHDGYIVSAAYDKEWQLKNWIVTSTASLAYISKDMTDYYVGLNSDEASASFAVYNAGSATVPSITLNAEYPLNENWTFNSVLTYIHLGNEIGNSPITIDNNEVTTISTSVRYYF